MNPNELRIGNKISYRGEKTCYVASLGYEFATEYYHNGLRNGSGDLGDYEPIALTEEWLLGFGFVKNQEYEYYERRKFILDHAFVLCDINIHVEVKYVHELQNLYFALTKKELIYNI